MQQPASKPRTFGISKAIGLAAVTLAVLPLLPGRASARVGGLSFEASPSASGEAPGDSGGEAPTVRVQLARHAAAPTRGSSAELSGGSSADRYGGSSADKQGVAGERDTRLHRPAREKTRKNDDKVRGGRDAAPDENDAADEKDEEN